MQIIDGKALARQVRDKVKTEIQTLDTRPGLAVILVGADPASHVYVGLKEKACVEAGIHFEKYLYFHTEPQDKIIDRIHTLNKRQDIHGILVQLPLPEHMDEDAIISAINPKKDVDGFHRENIKKLMAGNPYVIPPVHSGIITLIESTDVGFSDKKCAIIANSRTFGQPLKKLIEDKGAQTDLILPPFDQLDAILNVYDMVVVAVGKPGFIKGEWLKNGAVVIDAGTSQLEEGGIVGDVDLESCKQKNGWITPVPGGVGPMTIAMLLENLVRLAKNYQTE